MLPILLVWVARFRSNLRLRPINRIKHVFDEQGGVAAGSGVNVFPLITVDAPVITNPQQVETGSTTNGIFLTIEVNATSSAALANVYMYIAKNPGNNLSLPEANAVGISDTKRFVFHQEMVMLQQVTNSNPRTLFKGVIGIPKHFRRNAPADRYNIRIFTPGVAINYCVQAHYKEFR